MIQFIDVHKQFEDHPVLRGIHLTVESGRTMVILGPSGCGKSVLLKHIIGILQPDRGDVIVGEYHIPSLRRSALMEVRKNIGVLFQSSGLLDSMSVWENVALGLRMHTKLSDRAIDARVTECLARVGLPDVGSLNPEELSGGMKKRVGLARAIAMDPQYILYDEPTTGLDPKMAHVIGDLMRQLQGDLSVTSVVVTHDMDLALKVADQIALLWQGNIRVQGDPDEIGQSQNELLDRFIRGELEAEVEPYT